MSNIIDKIQVSGVTYDIGGGSITIDPTLDSGSTNPVANSAITTALDAKVNVADNIVSARTINYSYDAGDTSYKYPYNNGLIINEFYVKPVNQYTYTNTAAWNYVNISNGDSYTEIKVSVDCSNYKITAVTSTSGENFTYAIEDGVLHVTLSEGYTVRTIGQSQVFQISYEKYTIESGQTADVINEDLIDVIQDIYNQVPKVYLTAATPMLDSTRLSILNNKSDGNTSGQFISFGSSIKGDNNKLDAYLVSRYPTNVTLNTGTSNYCQVPSSTVNDYSSAFAYMNLFVNTGYTGSSTSFTFTVKTLFNNNTVQTDTFTYDVANKTIGGNQLYISVFCYDNTIHISPVQYNFSRIQSVSEPNCKIGGVDSPAYFKNQYIITGVTAASYTKQANTVINEIYSELNSKATTTYVDYSTSGKAETTAVTEAISEATSGKVDTSVYTAYTAATDTALAGKQTTLTAGTGIDITDNVISATGGGGGNPTVELTQAEYDALVTAGTVSADTYYIITDATAGDLTQYWTSAQTQSAITQSVSGKQDTLSAGTGIDITDNVISVTGGGGGKAIEAGRGITVTTGATADTVSFNLPISGGTNSIAEGSILTTASGSYSHAEGFNTTAGGISSHAEGYTSKASGDYSHAEGYATKAIGGRSHAEGYETSAMTSNAHAEGYNTLSSGDTSHAEGYNTVANGDYSHAEGYSTRAAKLGHAEGNYTTANTFAHAEGDHTYAVGEESHAEGYHTVARNNFEHASGQYNVSSSASTTFGDSGNTLFSVGNGTADNARHNAFEIRQNGDIYYYDGTNDVKLQDKFSSLDTTIGDINTILQSI